MKPLRALALLFAAGAVLLFAWAMLHRLAYPYDLEWMEGGQLTHALRILQHQPIYAPPSLEFIPYLYTPFYPILLAAVAKISGLGYSMARLISLLSFLEATVLGYVFARREGGDRSTAAAAMAIPIAAWVPTGQWYELARPDSLYLALVMTAICVAWWKRRSHLGGIAAALLLVAAFFTKQTASPFMVALGLALVAVNWRVALSYGATLGAVGLPLLYWANRASDGWFWTYVFRLHQSHEFYRARAWLGTPLWLLALVGPAAFAIPWALFRRRTPGLLWAAWFALTGVAVSCVGFGTQWAHINALVPGVFFPSVAMGVAAGRLIAPKPDAPPRLRPAAVFALLAMSLLLAPGILIKRFGASVPRAWAWHLHPWTGYDPRPYFPTETDRHAGDDLIARLRAAPGDVLIPFHPFYAQLAGKPTFLHRMGVMDIVRANLGPPRGLGEAIRQQRFSLAIFDDKIDGNWNFWPGMLEKYAITETIRGPRCPSGADTTPRYVLTPKAVLPPSPSPPTPTAPDREP
jgi:hypothetical protein